MEAVERLEGNLGERPQSRRMRAGVFAFMLTLVLAVAMLRLGAPSWYRMLLLAPFLFASNGIYMGLFRT